MAFEGLTDKLSAAFRRLRSKGRLTESDIKDAMREIRLALLEADVSYKVVKDFVKKVSERCVGKDVMEGLNPAQMVVKIVNEELTALMGSENQKLKMASNGPTIVMLVGLQGAGKTTHLHNSHTHNLNQTDNHHHRYNSHYSHWYNRRCHKVVYHKGAYYKGAYHKVVHHKVAYHSHSHSHNHSHMVVHYKVAYHKVVY